MMNKAILFLFSGLLFSACLKTEDTTPEIIIEPIAPRIVSTDSITSGEKWGLKIGDTPKQVYNAIQTINTQTGISYLSITNNFYSNLMDIENSIPLYNAILLDKQIGSAEGVQIYFKDDKIKFIYLNSGKQLQKWPNNVNSNATLKVNDEVNTIHQKLVNIKNIAAYKSILERISLFEKNVNKPYEDAMANTNQWYFTTPVKDKQFYEVHLNFKNNQLLNMYLLLREIR